MTLAPVSSDRYQGPSLVGSLRPLDRSSPFALQYPPPYPSPGFVVDSTPTSSFVSLEDDPSILDDDSLHSEEDNEDEDDEEEKKYRPTALLSQLAIHFIRAAAYAHVTKQEAVDAIQYVLSEHMPSAHRSPSMQAQLLDALVSHAVLIPCEQYFQVSAHNASQGVFVPLTPCYSPTCQSGVHPCYSPSCPRRKPTGPLRLPPEQHNTTVHEDTKEPEWFQNVPPHILQALPAKERKRQSAITELLASEQQYCNDLDILRDVYAQPLLNSSTAIEDLRRQRFHDIVFGNYDTIAELHRRGCAELMSHRQAHLLFVDRVGTIILRHVSRLMEPYLLYAANHVKAAYVVSVEANRSPAFARFLETQNSAVSTRRLGLRHYLTLPTLRIGKFRLLIKNIQKYTADDGDQLALSAALAELRDILTRMNEATHRAEIETRLLQIASSLTIPAHIPATLRQILPDHASLLHEGRLFLAQSSHSFIMAPCHIFLFSHLLVVTRPRVSADKHEEYIVAGKPIPLPMLHIGGTPRSFIRHLSSRVSSTLIASTSSNSNLLKRRSEDTSQTPFEGGTLLERDHSITGLYIRARFRRLRQSLRRHAQTAPMVTDAEEDSTLSSPLSPKSGLTLPARPHSRASPFRHRHCRFSPTPLRPMGGSVMISRLRSPLRSPAPKARASPPALLSKQRASRRLRLLKICHLGAPEVAYYLACPTVEDREQWRTWLYNLLTPIQKQGPFRLDPLCEVLIGSSRQAIMVSGSTMFPTGCGRIYCTLPFERPDGLPMMALGTQSGVWIGPRDGSQDFWLALAHDDCQQLAIIGGHVLLVRAHNRKKSLIAYDLERVCQPQQPESHHHHHYHRHLHYWVVRSRSVISFTVGTIRGQTVLCYLTRRRRSRGTCALVMMVFRTTQHGIASWFQKKKEYRLQFRDASHVQIAHDAVFVQSIAHGVERIDLSSSSISSRRISVPSDHCLSRTSSNHSIETTSSSSTSYSYATTSTSSSSSSDDLGHGPPIVGFVPLNRQHGIGFLYSAQAVWRVNYVDSAINSSVSNKIKPYIEFESRIQRVACAYPYLIAFSPTVIEVRHMETGEMVQAIGGSHIRCVYLSESDGFQPPSYATPSSASSLPSSSPSSSFRSSSFYSFMQQQPDLVYPTIHVTMLHPDDRVIRVYSLSLSSRRRESSLKADKK